MHLRLYLNPVVPAIAIASHVISPLYLPDTRFIYPLNLPASKYVGDFIYIATRYCRCAPSGRAEGGLAAFIRSSSRLIQLECRRRGVKGGRAVLPARCPWVFCSYPRHGLTLESQSDKRRSRAQCALRFLTWLIEQPRNEMTIPRCGATLFLPFQAR